eukprot:9495272-Pyramimonas_sp.AAC.1
MVLHLSIGNVILIAAYLQPKLNFTGRNRKIMAALTAFVRLQKDPWLVLADWNCVPSELLASGWIEQMRGEIVTGPGEVTCDKGKGSLYDYGVVSAGFKDGLTISKELAVPWAAHCGLRIRMAGKKQCWWHRMMDIPK